jgi:hypothetical protein
VAASRAGSRAGTLAGRQQDSTTASGQAAWAPPITRSASPTCPAPRASSAPNHASKANSSATAAAATFGRSPQGTEGPRRRAAAGQMVSPASPIEAQMKCGTEPKPPACSGFAATSMPAAAPPIRISRPGALAGFSASAVTM